jgi:Bacterial SH3 domain
LVTTVGGVALFLFLVRRPRSDDDPWSTDLVLATEPRSVAGAAHVSATAPRPGAGGAAPSGTTPTTTVGARAFTTAPANGVERVIVGYRRVRISSKPDAVRSLELGRLERGDEVEILESYEGFLRIRTPDGITGWVQRHTVARKIADAG